MCLDGVHVSVHSGALDIFLDVVVFRVGFDLGLRLEHRCWSLGSTTWSLAMPFARRRCG